MSEKILFVLNRKSAARSELRPMFKALQKELGLEIMIPWSRKQLRKAVARFAAKGGARIIAGGGDGTLNKVANALMAAGADVPLGLVPLGTANDFARAFGDSGSDLEASVRLAAAGPARPIDAGLINGTGFVNVASGGFGAMITATTPPEIKKHLGGLAYTLTGLARISELSPMPARLRIDEGEELDIAVSALVAANSRYAGGGFEVAPDAKLDDGLLDLGILSADTVLADGLTLPSLSDLKDPTDVLVERRQFQNAVLKTSAPFHLNLDGEPMVSTRFEMSVLPGRLNFVLPRRKG